MNNLERKEYIACVVGGSLLALNAGFVNSVTLTGFFSTTVSHMTGKSKYTK